MSAALRFTEYNADSASCHTGRQFWKSGSKNGYRGNGHNPAEGLLEGVDRRVETQPCASVRAHHAGQRCRRGLSRALHSALAAAGRFDTKILHGLGALSWGCCRAVNRRRRSPRQLRVESTGVGDGNRADREVSETEYAAVPIRTGHPAGEVRLIDVLRPEVLVFEPLWTVITAIRRSCRCCGSCSRTTATCSIPILKG